MRIAVLCPWTDPTGEFAKTFHGLLSKEVDATDVNIVPIDDMPESIVYREGMSSAAAGLDNLALCVPGVMKKAKALEEEGTEAIVNACVLGPGSFQASQVVDIPVLDPGEVAMHVASMLGHKFSILAPGMSATRSFHENIQRYGLSSKLASIRSTDINPASYVTKETETMNVLFDLSLKAIEEDDAAAIVLGCGMLTGRGTELKRRLIEHGHDVAVIQPVPLAVEIARVLVRLNLKHVRLVPAHYTYRF
jgi:allantoin racemase